MDAARGRTRACRDNRRCLRREAIEPLAGPHRLVGESARTGCVIAEGSPVPFAFDLLVGNRAFDHENEWIELSGIGLPEPLHEFVANLKVNERPMWNHFGQ